MLLVEPLGADMRRREFLVVMGGAAAWPVTARAQTPSRVYRIGFLVESSSRQTPQFAEFMDELRLTGFIEGQNLTVLDDGFNVADNGAAAAAMALVNAPADAIFASGVVRTKAVQTATKTLPHLNR